MTSGTSQGPEKNREKVRPQCLDEVATINTYSKVAITVQTTLWPDNIVTLLLQICRVPSSAKYSIQP